MPRIMDFSTLGTLRTSARVAQIEGNGKVEAIALGDGGQPKGTTPVDDL